MLMCTASEDYLACRKEFKKLQKFLPKGCRHIEVKNWGHMDFVWSSNAKDLIYPKIVGFLKG